MADEEVIIRIKVEGDDQLADIDSQLQEVAKAKAELNAKIKQGIELSAEEKKRYAELDAEQKKLNQQKREYNKQIETEIKNSRAAENSLAKMRAQLAKMRQEYEKLDPASEAATKMANEIKGLQEKINGADQATGNFRGNVGNYYNDIMKAITATKGMGAGLGSLGSALGAVGGNIQGLLMGGLNPYVAAVGAAVAIGGAMINSLKRSEEGQNQLSKASSILNGALADVADAFSTTVSGGGKFGQMLIWLSEKVAILTSWLIGGEKAVEEQKKKIELRKQIEDDAAALRRAQRAWMVEEERIQNQVDELRAKAAEKDKYNAAERRKFLQEAINLEETLANKKVYFAAIEFNLAKRRADLNLNDAAANDELAKKEAEYERARGDFARKTRELKGQIGELTNQELAAQKALNAEIERMNQAYENFLRSEFDKKMQENEEAIQKDFEEDYKKAKEDLKKFSLVDIHAQMIKTLDDYERETYSNTLEWKLKELEEQKKKGLLTELYYEKKSAEIKKQIELQKLGYVSNAIGQTLSMLREGTLAYRVLASAQSLIDTYSAATAALKPPPIGLGPLFGSILAAVTIAKGLYNIAQINAIKLQAGGVLYGNSHAQGGVPIWVKASGGVVEAEGGELIVNKNIWSRPDYVKAISRMNALTGGRDFASGGMVGDAPMGAQEPIRVYVVERDITNVQNSVRVSTQLGNL